MSPFRARNASQITYHVSLLPYYIKEPRSKRGGLVSLIKPIETTGPPISTSLYFFHKYVFFLFELGYLQFFSPSSENLFKIKVWCFLKKTSNLLILFYMQAIWGKFLKKTSPSLKGCIYSPPLYSYTLCHRILHAKSAGGLSI